jgi:pimeloyl-ACP methyl ester carboxylesterase
MRTLDITFRSTNSATYPKPITALVVEPDAVGQQTGVLLVSHGWGGNRRDYLPTMEYAARELGLLCLSVEFRGSGYDFDPVTGKGSVVPYDGSFYQLFDVLSGLRTVLTLYPGVDRQRMFHYGGSQGGHLALLSAIYAPASFALVYATSPAVRLDAVCASWAGRSFEPWELSARDVVEHAERIRCPVLLEHGTVDAALPMQTHTSVLEARLRELGKQVESTYIQGGGHGLEPVTSRLDRFKLVMPARAGTRRPAEPDDFAAGRIVEMPCAGKTVRVDWSRPPDSVELVRVL